MSWDMKISPRTMSCILKDDLHLGAYKRAGHLWTEKFKKYDAIEPNNCSKDSRITHFTRSFLLTRKLSVLKSHSTNKIIAYTQSSEGARNKFPRVLRGHHPESVMIWWGISYNHVTPIHFREKEVKTSGVVYWNMLDEVVEPLNETLFDGEH